MLEKLSQSGSVFITLTLKNVKYVDAEVQYMYRSRHGRAVLLQLDMPLLTMPKSDNTPRFCTGFHKVYALTKPDSFLLSHVEIALTR